MPSNRFIQQGRWQRNGFGFVHGTWPGRPIRWGACAEEPSGFWNDGRALASRSNAEAVIAPVQIENWQRGTAKLKILLVDDEEIVRHGTAEMLKDFGHEIVEAGSGAIALGLLRSQGFDILVTDYLMPAMSGLELAREARIIRHDLPILMITGFADLAEDAASDVARLAKPFHLEELGRAIEEQFAMHFEPVENFASQ